MKIAITPVVVVRVILIASVGISDRWLNAEIRTSAMTTETHSLDLLDIFAITVDATWCRRSGVEVAIATDGDVHFGTTDELGCLAGDGAAGEVRVLLVAGHADGGDLDDFLGEGDQVADLAEGAAAEVAVQTDDDDGLAGVGGLGAELDEVGEELAFVDGDRVEVVPLVSDLGELLDGVRGLDVALIVRREKGLGVAVVLAVADDADAAAGVDFTLDTTLKFSGLASEHGADNEGEFSSHFVFVCIWMYFFF